MTDTNWCPSTRLKRGLKVVAQGMEAAAQRGTLRAVDCDYAQGHLFSRPLAATQFDKLLSVDG